MDHREIDTLSLIVLNTGWTKLREWKKNDANIPSNTLYKSLHLPLEKKKKKGKIKASSSFVQNLPKIKSWDYLWRGLLSFLHVTFIFLINYKPELWLWLAFSMARYGDRVCFLLGFSFPEFDYIFCNFDCIKRCTRQASSSETNCI